LKAGLGFGGFCLPKDVQAFVHLADQVGVDFGLLKEAERVNRQRIDRLMDKVREHLWVVKDKQVALLGLAFKPFTDDIRLAPSLDVIRHLQTEGAKVRATDPEAMERMRAVFPDLTYNSDPYEIARGADALLVVTEWPQFKQLDWSRIQREMARPLVLDTRNMLDPQTMKLQGFEYDSFGRPEANVSVPAETGR
jgi:UDPglucose 6-dehydrogenase